MSVRQRVTGNVRGSLRGVSWPATEGVTAAIQAQDIASIYLGGPTWLAFYSTVPDAVEALLRWLE